MPKRNIKANICRLCFNTQCEIDFKEVEIIKDVLGIVMPKLNLEEGDKHLICNSCSVKLFAAFNFKSVCTDTEDTIFPYVNSQEMPLADLREIYLKEKGDIQSIEILKNQKICRLCFQSVRYGFVSLNEVDADIIDNYIPELNFNATKDPVICKVCSDSLVTHGTFLNSCLAAQEENMKVYRNPSDDRECCIKTEEIKIEDDCDSYPPTRLENVETIKNFDDIFSSENIPVEYKKHLLGKVQIYSCNRCNFKAVHKYSMKRHCLSHISSTPKYIAPKSQCQSKTRDASPSCPLKDHMRMYQCEKCPYRTHVNRAFKSHWLTHKVPSKIKVYQCEICHYRVTREDHFRRHELKHEDSAETIGNFKSTRKSKNIAVKNKKRPPKEVWTYPCNKCEFKTVHKRSLKRHYLTHASLTPLKPQGQMYQCGKCPYRTHLKSASISHWSTHAVPSQVKVYHCEECHFRTIRKDHFLHHQLEHEDDTKVQIFTCDHCDFQTRHEMYLFQHQLKHDTEQWRDIKCYATGDGEVMYKCNVCKYETKDKRQLLVHQSNHAHSSSEPKFKCQMCPYKSDNKDKLTRHQAKHNSGMKTLKCDLCSYQTIYKNNLITHQLRHQKKCEVETHECLKCNFTTKYKGNLKTHMLVHKVQQLRGVK